MRILAIVLVALLAPAVPAGAKTFSELFPDVSYEDAAAQALVDSLDYQQGEIKIATAGATLKVPASFYFLSAASARRVLVDAWGNPPSSAEGVLGILFPSSMTPHDVDAWGAIVTYLDAGYIATDDARPLDHDSVLAAVKASTHAGNSDRTKAGYDQVTLIGWASPPYYDRSQHKLHWATELTFGTADGNTVNYNVRALGRRGVLELSFITDMNHLTEVKAAMPDVLAMVSFDKGSRYEDYISSIDKVAAYGIDGLITGAAGTNPGVPAMRQFWLVLAILLFGATGILWLKLRGRKGATPTDAPPNSQSALNP